MENVLLNEIENEIKQRNITRLCHFTNSRKALHILGSESGVVAVDFLDKDIYDANDQLRIDGRKDCVNCSIQYPNYWYYNRVKNNDNVFKDWVILLIKPELLLLDTTRFCFTNAAFRSGQCIGSGIEAFRKMFSPVVTGKRTFIRTPKMLSNCPTDDQAEVLIYKNISRNDIFAVAVPDEAQARREKVKWSFLPTIPDIDIIIAPELFDVGTSKKVRDGIVPYEYKYDGGECDG